MTCRAQNKATRPQNVAASSGLTGSLAAVQVLRFSKRTHYLPAGSGGGLDHQCGAELRVPYPHRLHLRTIATQAASDARARITYSTQRAPQQRTCTDLASTRQGHPIQQARIATVEWRPRRSTAKQGTLANKRYRYTVCIAARRQEQTPHELPATLRFRRIESVHDPTCM